MPDAARRRCPGCKQLVAGRCATCTPAWSTKPKSWSKGASDRRWRGVRAHRLARDPQCWCGADADTVDHVDDTDYEDDTGVGRSWLNIEMTRSLCTPHHRTRTGLQGASARHSRS